MYKIKDLWSLDIILILIYDNLIRERNILHRKHFYTNFKTKIIYKLRTTFFTYMSKLAFECHLFL